MDALPSQLFTHKWRNIEIRLENYALFYSIKTYESRRRKITVGKERERENGEVKLEKKRP